MLQRKSVAAGVMVALLALSDLLAQTDVGRLTSDFSRNNNTYAWESRYKGRYQIGGLSAVLGFNMSSNLTKRPIRRWQENIGASATASYVFSPALSLSPAIGYTRDALENKIFDISDVKLSAVYSGLRFFDLVPFAGGKMIHRRERQKESNDLGPGAGLAITSKNAALFSHQVSAKASYESYRLDRIPFDQLEAIVAGYGSWTIAESLAWRFYEMEASKKYYSGVSGVEDVVKQVKMERGAEGIGHFHLPASVNATVSMGVKRVAYYYRSQAARYSISENDNLDERRGFELHLEKKPLDRVQVSVGYRWSGSNQDFWGTRLDLRSESGEFTIGIGFYLSGADSVSLNGLVGVTSYYGPTGSLGIDRDLQTAICNFCWAHNFSRFLATEVKAGYSNFHQIYISGLYSASNNQNRTFLISPIVRWRPWVPVRLVQTFEIQANYIIFDFDRQAPDTRSRIFRRASSSTRLECQIGRRLTVMPAFTYRYEDYGKLLWLEENWQQATGWDRRYHRLDLKLVYQPWPSLQFEPSYTVEFKREYAHSLGHSGLGEAVVRTPNAREDKHSIGASVSFLLGQDDYIRLGYAARVWNVDEQRKDLSEFVNVSVRYGL